MYDNKNTEKAKILIVDDVEMNRMILEAIIDNMGVESLLAESGEQALEMVKSYRPQLVLTDISMPGMDGYELCRILKRDEKTKDIPIIFISAYGDAHDIIEGFELGGEDYITKPFVAEIVKARVGVQLRLHEANRELADMNRKLQISVNEQLRQMELEKKNILYAIANISAHNADYEEQYIERMQKNCRLLAQGMQLSPAFEGKVSDTFIDTIELAVSLCDIGNIGVPKELLKKTELTKEEEDIVRSHTNIGAKLLQDIYVNSDYNDFIRISIEVTRYHHENWDGSGYPDGLAGNNIPLSAQIVSVVERYCTLTGNENYSKEEALGQMDSESGVKFNPDIFKICNKISRQLC